MIRHLSDYIKSLFNEDAKVLHLLNLNQKKTSPEYFKRGFLFLKLVLLS
jgi:hypothetical protein